MDNDQLRMLRDVSASKSEGKDCLRIEELLNDYLDCELQPQQSEEVEKHLQRCANCRELEKDLRFVTNTAKELADYPIPSAVSRRLRERLASELNFEYSGRSAHLHLVKSK